MSRWDKINEKGEIFRSESYMPSASEYNISRQKNSNRYPIIVAFIIIVVIAIIVSNNTRSTSVQPPVSQQLQQTVLTPAEIPVSHSEPQIAIEEQAPKVVKKELLPITRSLNPVAYTNVLLPGSRVEAWILENGVETRQLSVQSWRQSNGQVHVTLAEDIQDGVTVNIKCFPSSTLPTTHSVDIVYPNILQLGSRIEIRELENGVETRLIPIKSWSQSNNIVHIILEKDEPAGTHFNAHAFPPSLNSSVEPSKRRKAAKKELSQQSNNQEQNSKQKIYTFKEIQEAIEAGEDPKKFYEVLH